MLMTQSENHNVENVRCDFYRTDSQAHLPLTSNASSHAKNQLIEVLSRTYCSITKGKVTCDEKFILLIVPFERGKGCGNSFQLTAKMITDPFADSGDGSLMKESSSCCW